MTTDDIQPKWERLVQFMSEKFSDGSEELDLQAILFIIGIQELGRGYQDFSKEEKMDLLHIAICKLLSKHGYYEFEHKDDDGWPHYKINKKMPPLSPKKQTELMKESILEYFEDAKIEF